MQFDTKIAVVIRTDLEPWQKLNVASFLTSGIAAAFPQCIGEPYEDGSGTKYLSLNRSADPDLRRRPGGADPRARAGAGARCETCGLYRGHVQDHARCRQSRGGEGGAPRRSQSGRPRHARRTQGDRQDRRRLEVSQLAHDPEKWIAISAAAR